MFLLHNLFIIVCLFLFQLWNDKITSLNIIYFLVKLLNIKCREKSVTFYNMEKLTVSM